MERDGVDLVGARRSGSGVGASERQRVVIVDDHPVSRQGLRIMLELLDGVEVVGEAERGEDGVRLCRAVRPTLVVLDLNMPGMNGIEALREIKFHLSDTRAFMFSVEEDPAVIVSAIHAGADGWISKTATLDEFRSAIEALGTGGVFLSASITGPVLRHLGRADDHRTPVTDREGDVLRLLSQGLTAASISRRLGIRERTVTTHIESLYRRLGVNNRVDAVMEGLRLGIVELPELDARWGRPRVY